MDIQFENKYYADDKMGKEYVHKILAKNAREIILLYILIFLSILINWILRGNLSEIYWMIICIVILLLFNFYNALLEALPVRMAGFCLTSNAGY